MHNSAVESAVFARLYVGRGSLPWHAHGLEEQGGDKNNCNSNKNKREEEKRPDRGPDAMSSDET